MKIGDYVTRKKYNNDILFKIDKIENGIIYLKGVDIRLYADAKKEDLVLATISKKKDDEIVLRVVDTDNYFYLPGTILHLDSDIDYMNKCEELYKKENIKYYSYVFNESEFQYKIKDLINKHNPNILIITGHDAYYKNRKNNKYYKNSDYFINTVKEARKIKKNQRDLIIVSGACQSNYSSLMKSGSTFASSPGRINIHALDPAIIGSYISKTPNYEIINVIELVNKTKYKSDGFGGLSVFGVMYKGYPRDKERIMHEH